MSQEKKIKQIPLLVNSCVLFASCGAILATFIYYLVCLITEVNPLNPSAQFDFGGEIFNCIAFGVLTLIYAWSSLYILGRSIFTCAQLIVSYRKMAIVCFFCGYASIFTFSAFLKALQAGGFLCWALLSFAIINILNVIAIVAYMFIMRKLAKREILEQKVLKHKRKKRDEK